MSDEPAANEVPGDIALHPIGGEARTLGEWTTNFHLVFVVIDPFTFESAWLLDLAGGLLRHFSEADCRTAWLVEGSEANARQFLGPWVEEFLTFVDEDKSVAKALEVERVPAFVHLNVDHQIDAMAQGWDPEQWQEVSDNLAKTMSWSSPKVNGLGGPAPFEGSALAR